MSNQPVVIDAYKVADLRTKTVTRGMTKTELIGGGDCDKKRSTDDRSDRYSRGGQIFSGGQRLVQTGPGLSSSGETLQYRLPKEVIRKGIVHHHRGIIKPQV